MPTRTRARCLTESKNLTKWSIDPQEAIAASDAHAASNPQHSVTIIVEQTASLKSLSLATKKSSAEENAPAAKQAATVKKEPTAKKRGNNR